MENFDLRKYLAENRLLKEEIDINKISKLGDYNETEDSYKYKDHFVQKYIDGGKTTYAVFKDRGEKTDSYGSPDFESSDLKKVEDFLTENKLIKEEMSLEIDDDFIEPTADSGTYDAYIEDDGTVDFSVTYEDEDDRDGEEFDEDNWKDILGPKHAFVKITNQIPTTKVEAAGDYVMITVDLEDLEAIAD